MITRLGKEYPTHERVLQVMVENGLYRGTMYSTKAELDAALDSADDLAYAVVTDDRTGGEPTEFNGFWQKQSGVWVYLAWNPLTQFLVKLQAAIAESKQYTDEQVQSNLLFDPFNETIEPDGTDRYQSVARALFTTIKTDSVYSTKPTLKGSGSSNVRRYFDVKKMGVLPGNKVYIRVCAAFESATATAIRINLRKRDESIEEIKTYNIEKIGLTDITFEPITMTSESGIVLVELLGATDKELIAVSIAKHEQPKLIYGAIYPQICTDIASLFSTTEARIDKVAKNLMPDPFFRLASRGIKVDGYDVVEGSTHQLVDFFASPFNTKYAIYFSSAVYLPRLKVISFKRLNARAGDKFSKRNKHVILSRSAI